ncbi:MAG TPA: hypothetical protein EYP04_03195, partial [Anaerolineae bacterium]|nr:hypothetical protein [Anaerolineae bacterium]
MEMTRSNSIVRLGNGVVAELSSIGISPLGLVLLLALAIVPLFIQDEYILQLMVSSAFFGA